MKIINLGSINVDYVYALDHIVAPGETVPSQRLQVNPGGKGANQSVACARAGATVLHVGQVGHDTAWMIDRLSQNGVDTRHVTVADTVNGGQAIIQVDSNGQNAIIVFGGANQAIPEAAARTALAAATPGDWLLLQNEINLTSRALQPDFAPGLKVCFNPAPMTPEVQNYPLERVDLFIVNEIEGAELARVPRDTPFETILNTLAERFPKAAICLTLGSQGALYHDAANGTIVQKPYPARAVDTTAAGDTFTGYLLAALTRGDSITNALDLASRAAAITVSRPGAMDSIPLLAELK